MILMFAWQRITVFYIVMHADPFIHSFTKYVYSTVYQARGFWRWGASVGKEGHIHEHRLVHATVMHRSVAQLISMSIVVVFPEYFVFSSL